MCSFNEQDWTELAKLTEAAGADALEVREQLFYLLFDFCSYDLVESFVSTWNGFVGRMRYDVFTCHICLLIR